MSADAEFLAATIRTATPLLLAATGELIIERAGIIFVGIEGSILAGALAAAAGGFALGAGAGVVLAILAGAAAAAIFALFVVRWRAEQIVTGTAITLLATGATAALYRILFGTEGAGLRVPVIAPLAIPGLARIPVIGGALFAQSVFSYAAVVALGIVWWGMARTHLGLALRACGERPVAARSAGVATGRVRTGAAIAAGAFAGAAGASLVLVQSGTFAEGMSAGRGFIAIAIVALGRWRPGGVLVAALAFGAASALQYLFQARGWTLPYQAFLALPYVATLVALATARARGAAPAALGQAEEREEDA
ncbi:MAG TPA: ABC transporter permease [Gemmatimonadaceae bacterium]|nr:ABC transporter permease [Gemmatimonadaceae bacterium]